MTWIKCKDVLPGHKTWAQSFSWCGFPMHGFPPLKGWGLVQGNVLWDVPFSHVLLHRLHAWSSSNPPSTKLHNWCKLSLENLSVIQLPGSGYVRIWSNSNCPYSRSWIDKNLPVIFSSHVTLKLFSSDSSSSMLAHSLLTWLRGWPKSVIFSLPTRICIFLRDVLSFVTRKTCFVERIMKATYWQSGAR